MSKEAVLFLLPAHTTEIVCDQDCLWIKVLPWNLHTEWLCLQALSSLSIHVVRSVSVYSNLLVYEWSVFEFLRRHLGTNCCFQCLFWADIGSQIFSNAQNTVTSHGGLCSSSSITTMFSFFLSAFLWSFVLIIFNIYIFRTLFLYILYYGGFAPELYEFSTQL